uniref:Uncharacterized protein n=1 Tax=Timema monikensis TaxID=170555 RepID=A0A7R9E9F6_9NEOP|nr:unnamed protein product [Timema monikensis]
MYDVTAVMNPQGYTVQTYGSTDSGWDNPFRPDGDLSREADEIVELIKGGKPITPTPGSVAPKLPFVTEAADSAPSSPTALTAPTVQQSPPQRKVVGANGAAPCTEEKQPLNSTPAPVEVKRETVVPASDASQVEHVVLKKKPKCKCCVIQKLVGPKSGVNFTMMPLALPTAILRWGSQLHLASKVNPSHQTIDDHWTVEVGAPLLTRLLRSPWGLTILNATLTFNTPLGEPALDALVDYLGKSVVHRKGFPKAELVIQREGNTLSQTPKLARITLAATLPTQERKEISV